MSKFLSGVLCLAIPVAAGADLLNTASVSYRDPAGVLRTGISNTVTTTVSSSTLPPAPPSPPDLSGLDGKTFSPADTMVLPYTDQATTFVWEFDPVSAGGSSGASAPASTLAHSPTATISTPSPSLSLAALSLASGAYTLRVRAVSQGQTSVWASARIFWVGAVDLNSIRVYPNPFRAARGDTQMMFDQLPVGSTVKIFTVSARSVKTLSASGGMAPWDLTNDSGEKVASGIYLYLITDAQGNRTRGKFTVIR